MGRDGRSGPSVRDEGKCIFKGEQGPLLVGRADMVGPRPAAHALPLRPSGSKIRKGTSSGFVCHEILPDDPLPEQLSVGSRIHMAFALSPSLCLEPGPLCAIFTLNNSWNAYASLNGTSEQLFSSRANIFHAAPPKKI